MCLLRYGVEDLSAFSTRRHLQLSQHKIKEEVEPKLSILVREGLTPVQLKDMFGRRRSPLFCSFSENFQPNVEILAGVVSHRDAPKPSKRPQQLSRVGQVLAASPFQSNKYLRREPQDVQQLLSWITNKLGLGPAALASSPSLLAILSLQLPTCQAVTGLLQALNVPPPVLSNALLTQPSLFTLVPALLEANLRCLQRELHLSAPAALQLALGQPSSLRMRLEERLPALLAYLDEVAGGSGGGPALVLRGPVLLNCSRASAAECVAHLTERGFDTGAIRIMLRKSPGLLTHNLGSPTQQHKLDWITQVSPWTLADFLVNPRYLIASTRRLASRLDYLLQHDIPPSPSPGALAVLNDVQFMAMLRKQFLRGGSKAALPEWNAWMKEWLQSPAGQQWGDAC